MNILNVNMSIDPVMGGGTAERTLQLSSELVKAGYSCKLLTLDTGLSEDFKNSITDKGILSIYLPCIFQRFYVPAPVLPVIALAVKNSDVVNIMGHWTIVNALVFGYCLYYRKPYTICPAGALRIFGRSRVLKRVYNSFIGKQIVREARACIAITQDEIPLFTDYGVAPEQVTVIPNGINPDHFQDADDALFRQKHGLTASSIILFMGRLNAIKGPDLLLEAFLTLADKFPDHDLVYAGPDGGLLNELQKRAASLLKKRIHFLGYLGGKEKSRAYHAADLLVIPSRQEAMSIVVLEAGIAGTPVLITDQCGFNIIDSIGGGKVVPASVEGIAQGLESMLEEKQLPEMGRRLHDYVNSNFLWSHIVQRYIALNESLLPTRIRKTCS